MNHHAEKLAAFIADAGTIAVLTGAGVSTASGIPGYRDRDGNWKHARPVQYQDFVAKAAVRQRYWARSVAGWGRMAEAQPNEAHVALVALEEAGTLESLITQNVDNLHRRAGSRDVIDLHGTLEYIVCLGCGQQSRRADWQERLTEVNSEWEAAIKQVKPDGDAEIDDAAYVSFNVPDCSSCGGIVKPDVVFFGENVPRQRVAAAQAAVARAGALLVAGSSLMVWSGLRFVRQAREEGKPVAIVNRGHTRASDEADLLIDEDCGKVLSALVALQETPAWNERRA